MLSAAVVIGALRAKSMLEALFKAFSLKFPVSGFPKDYQVTAMQRSNLLLGHVKGGCSERLCCS